MALIACKECGKEISDQALSCPNCGCPVNVKSNNEDIQDRVKNKYSKFDFEYIKQVVCDPNLLEKYKKLISSSGKRLMVITSIIFILSGMFSIGVEGSPVGILGLFGMGISLLLFFKGLAMVLFPKLNGNIEKEIIEYYYKDKIKRFTIVPNDLDYEEISLISAKSEDELIEKAYDLQADALINQQVQKYTSSDTRSSFNGVGAEKNVRTKVKTHENWTAAAVRINSNEYHEKIDGDKLLEMLKNKG